MLCVCVFCVSIYIVVSNFFFTNRLNTVKHSDIFGDVKHLCFHTLHSIAASHALTLHL